MAKKPYQTDVGAKVWVKIVCGFLGFLMIFGVLVMAISALTSTAAEVPTVTTQPDQQISVGLYCNETAVQSYTLYAVKGFQVQQSPAGYSIQLKSSALTAAVDANLYRVGNSLYTESIGIATVGGYHIQISQFSFSDLIIDEDHDNPVYIESKNTAGSTNGYTAENVNEYIELLTVNRAFQALSLNAFPYYVTENECYIRVGNFYSSEDAAAAMEQLNGIITAKCEVVGPDQKTVTFLDQNYSILCECKYSNSTPSFTITPWETDQFTDQESRSYRGSIEVIRSTTTSSNGLTVVNHLSLETYVSLLLSSEVSAHWNEELLKSMAVILRTKVTKLLDCHKADGFDICANSHCHMYLGNSVIDSKILSVVESTAGQILTYEGKPIYTPYSIYNGSSTISSADAFGNEIPYLTSIYTPWESDTYWKVEFTPYELYQILSSAGYTQINGNIDSVKITGRAKDSDYVSELTITDIFGSSMTIQGSEIIRILFGGKLPSACFYVGKAGETVTVTKRTLTTDLQYTEEQKDIVFEGTYGNFVFLGSGEGCGVGFSIRGGLALANLGMTYDQILAVYFPNSVISTTHE